MKTIVKRNGKVVRFDSEKIYHAIEAAFIAVDGSLTNESNNITKSITKHIEAIDKQLTVEEIQDIVEDSLMTSNRKDVARAYIKYRFKREVLRKENTTDKTVMELISGNSDYWNNENANKNARIVTTQRDYIAGTTSTDITRRFLLDKDVVHAHDEGYIHFHDADYFLQNALHNCFSKKTKFICSDGVVRSFSMFRDGDIIKVISHTGKTHKARVKCYGNQFLYKISFENENHIIKEVLATRDHKWLLNNGRETSYIEVGDILMTCPNVFNLPQHTWRCESIVQHSYEDVWCLNVDVDHSFIIEDGLITGNCELVNLDDVLQNGTVLNGVKIDKPHRLITASTIATQVILAVTSSSYGGCTVSLTHLAPFVRDSYKAYYKKYINNDIDETTAKKLADLDLKKEVADAVQTFNYQVNSMTCVNGQAPFLSVCMYLNENPEYKKEVAMLTEEFLKQRMLGFKNEKDVYISPAFPKLLYFLEDDNIHEGDEYWYLTELAAKCTAKRMVPDYISEKVMKELKGDVYPCMGAVSGDSIINIIINGEHRKITFQKLWDIMHTEYGYEYILQPHRTHDYYIDCENSNIQISDYNRQTNNEIPVVLTNVKKITCIHNINWLSITTKSGNHVLCTYDHPFPVMGTDDDLYVAPNSEYNFRGYSRIEAKDLKIGDVIISDSKQDPITHIEHIIKDDYAYDVETVSDTFIVNDLWSSNCRSFLTPDRFHTNLSKALNYIENKGQYYGRFNQGVVTLSLPDIALSSNGDENKFWEIFDERMELCHRALQSRHNRLENGISDMAPILWQHGALARLDKGESIKDLLHHGYSTISLGYAGLYECVKYMTGVSHTDPKGKEFGLKVMKALNDKCKGWKATEDIDYSVYGTPIESTTYKFAKSLKKRFGDDVFIKLDGRDRNYITNSYHIPVFEEIDPFKKLELESEFQALSPGGAISYIECASLEHNPDAVLEVIKFIYDNIMYAELNIKSDYCHVCGYDGEIKIIDDNNSLEWECPNCGNRDHSKMNVARRTCGYIGTNFFNQGRTNEIRDRYVHLDDKLCNTIAK